MEQHTELELERMQQMLLSSHFTLGEFLRSGTAIKYGIDNTPQDRKSTRLNSSHEFVSRMPSSA